MALRVALDNPHLFAGVASLGGPPADGPYAAAADRSGTSSAGAAGRMVGKAKPMAKIGSARISACCIAPGMSVMLRQYPSGDELTALMLRDLDAWMMQLVTGEGGNASSDAAVNEQP